MPAYRESSSRAHLRAFAREASESIPPGSLVLDAGAGEAPYAPLFAQHRYETADFAAVDKAYADRLTYVCDLSSIPVEDGRFDLVLLSQVLEHIPEPSKVLGEIRRVVKPAGALWLSAPLFYEEHEQPYDFYRYTQFSLRELVEAAGFQVVRLEWLEGYLGTLGYQLRMAGRSLPSDPAAYGGSRLWAGGARLARPVLRWIGRQLDSFDERGPWKGGGMPKNYVLVAISASNSSV